jgi:ferritin-like metal-binding protein YciE
MASIGALHKTESVNFFQGGSTMRMASLRDLYQQQLLDLRQTEVDYLEVLPTLQSAACSYSLAKLFHDQIAHAQEHIRRLDSILILSRERESPKVAELTQVCRELSKHAEAIDDVRDVALIAAVQRFRHEQISGYGCARAWARVLGEDDARIVLEKCLIDEKNCDAELTRIAEGANVRAAAALVTV